MNKFLSYVKKEFFHIFRDRQTAFILFLMPVVQIILFGFAITTDIRNTSIGILDLSHSSESRALIAKIVSGAEYDIAEVLSGQGEIENIFRKGKIRQIVVFPADFSAALAKGSTAEIEIITDGSNPNEANILTNYMFSIVGKYQQELLKKYDTDIPIDVRSKMLYNSQLKSSYTFVPGVIGLVLMLICTLMTSISIVREKEKGTMEVILASPAKPLAVIVSKTIPYLVISIINIIVVIILSLYVMDVPVRGSITLLMILSVLYIFTSLALGMLISTISATQQIAMIISLVGLMLPTILLSGLMFPIESMPAVLQWFSKIVPATWFISASKTIMIKGLGFGYVWKEIVVLLIITGLCLGTALSRFKIRL
ncbi:MAG: ABC transporter permease [Bacteroidales bacterium]|jgi:ABC-2 type transport system permease protein|nr:ABC transporter permease [Bacteroidales bacterium]